MPTPASTPAPVTAPVAEPAARPMVRPGLVHLRPLDGVRGLAVLAVLLHHARVPWLPAGFIGVDVFFTLSGFLITSLLLVEVRRTGRVRLASFWAGRARRLLPALLLVVTFVGATGVWWLQPGPRAALVGDGVAAVFYLANWRVLGSGSDYFATFGQPSPLSHTWSLGVEEQFYLLWPPAVVAVVALLRRAGVRRSWRRRLVAAVLAGTCLLVAASAALTRLLADDTMRAYYGTDTRAQELLGGAALGVAAVAAGWWRPRYDHAAPVLRGVLTAVGLVGLVGLGVLATTVRDAPGFVRDGGFALVTVLTVAVLASLVHPAGGPVARVLGWRPLAALGVVSYGVYLWHWPLFVLLDPARTGLGGSTTERVLLTVLRVGVTVAVAVVSYRLVERPVRSFRWDRTDSSVRVLVPLAALTVALAALVVPAALVPADPGAAGTRATAGATPDGGSPGPAPEPAPVPATGPSGGPTDAPAPSASTTRDGPRRVFLLGDSTAFLLHSTFRPADPAVRVTGSTQLGCDLLGGELTVDGSRLGTLPVCADWPAGWQAQVAADRPDAAVVMLGNGMLFDRVLDGRTITFGSPEHRALLLGWLDATVERLAASSGRVYVTDLPCFGKRDTGLDGTAAVVNDPRRQRLVNQLVRAHLAGRADVTVLDLRSRICPGDRFAEQVDGVQLRPDGVHWSQPGAGVVWSWLLPAVAR